VLFERSTSEDTPTARHNKGRANRIRNASILPPRVTVISGRQMRTLTRTILKTISESRSGVASAMRAI